MEENNNYIDELIVSFLSGELNQEGRDELKAWIDESEAHRRYFLQRQELWFSALAEEERRRKNVHVMTTRPLFASSSKEWRLLNPERKKPFGYLGRCGFAMQPWWRWWG